MKYKWRKLILILFALVVVASCASTNKNPEKSTVSASTAQVKAEVPPVPKFIEIRIWKIQSVESSYPDGMPTGTVNYQYDTAGLLQAEETVDANKLPVSKIIYNRKADGTTEKSSYNNSGDLIGK